MNPAEAVRKAAQLFSEYKDGDEFETNIDDTWYNCLAGDVVDNLKWNRTVRLKPRPKKVLRPIVEIFTEAARRGLLTYQNVGDKGVLYASGFGVAALDEGRDYGFPDYFYAGTPGDDRIETVSANIAYNLLLNRNKDGHEQITEAEVITDELRKAGF